MTAAWHGHERGYGEEIQSLNDYDNREQSHCHQGLLCPHDNIGRFQIITKNAGRKHRIWGISTTTGSDGSHTHVHYHR